MTNESVKTDTVETSATDNVEKSSYLTQEQADLQWRQKEQALMSKFEKLLEQRVPKAPKVDEEKLSRTAELEKTVKDLSENIRSREARERDQALRSTVTEAARNSGFDRDFEDHLVSYLVDAKKLVRYAEDGSLQMTVNGVVYDRVQEGMLAFSKTKDAKLYRPATGAAGTGEKNKTASYGDQNPVSDDGMPVIKRDSNGRMTAETRAQLDRFFK